MIRRRSLWIVVGVVLVAMLGYQLANHEAPRGQPPLVTLDAGLLPAFRADFNRAASDTRIILLLSPM